MKRLTFIAILVAVVGTCFIVSAFAEDFYVIPVNNKCGSCKGTRSSGGRWCDNGDGTITDMTTCLVWLKYANWGGLKHWEDCSTHDDAHTRAGLLASGETISASGGTAYYLTDGSVEGDWRLPTKTELSSIINEGGETVCASNMQLFLGVQDAYWSSTAYAPDTASAWGVFMTNGSVVIGGKAGNGCIWPVRGGN